MPHNWALIKPGTLAKVGDLANKIIAEPDAAARQYIPRTDDVLVYTDIVEPRRTSSSIYFQAPDGAGPVSVPLHFPGALDGHERRHDRGVTESAIHFSRQSSNTRKPRSITKSATIKASRVISAAKIWACRLDSASELTAASR